MTDVVIQQNSRKLLMMDILMSKTCWAHKKWNNNSKWHKVGLLFFNVLYTFGTKFWSFPIDFTILSFASHVLSTQSSTDDGIRASFFRGWAVRGQVFSIFPLPHLPYVSSWARFFYMYWLFSGFGDICQHSEFLQKYRAISVALRFHPFAAFFITVGIRWTCSAEATFAKWFWSTAGMMDSHAMETPHMARKMFQFLASFVGTFLFLTTRNEPDLFDILISYNKWCPGSVVASTCNICQ